MLWSKQSTAATVIIGPILDSTGAEYTGAVISDISLSKNGATLTALASAASLTHIANGQYELVLTTGNTDTLGRAQFTCNKSTYQMPPLELMVIPATVFDALVTNTTNTTGGLPAATGAISSLAGAVSTYAGGAVASVTAGVTVTTNNDKTGYALSQAFPTNFSALSISGAGKAASTVASGDDADAATLLTRLTSARAGYLDNLNVGGAVASHADVLAINTSSSKHLILTTVGQYERPESGNTVYTVEVRTFSAADGSAVNADTTPTLAATGQTSGSLAANLGVATNPATGVYRWTYTVSSAATPEPIRFDASATISASTFTLSAYTQVVDEVSTTWTATDALHLTSIFNKLPAGNLLDAADTRTATGLGSANLDAQLNSIYTVAGLVQTKTDNLPSDPAGLAGLASAHGSGSWATATGFSTLDATGVRSAIGLAVANLDTQLGGIPAASVVELFATAVEAGVSVQAVLRVLAAFAAGKRSNCGTTNEQYDAIGSPGTARIVGNLDASGNGLPTVTP